MYSRVPVVADWSLARTRALLADPFLLSRRAKIFFASYFSTSNDRSRMAALLYGKSAYASYTPTSVRSSVESKVDGFCVVWTRCA